MNLALWKYLLWPGRFELWTTWTQCIALLVLLVCIMFQKDDLRTFCVLTWLNGFCWLFSNTFSSFNREGYEYWNLTKKIIELWSKKPICDIELRKCPRHQKWIQSNAFNYIKQKLTFTYIHAFTTFYYLFGFLYVNKFVISLS